MPLGLLPQRNLTTVIDALTQGPRHQPNCTGHFVRDATEPVFGVFPQTLRSDLVHALAARGISSPYDHQAKAIESVLSGKHITLTTPTASGKTLCYNVPVLNGLLNDPKARALYLFPTKALSQDQYAGLHALIEHLGADLGSFVFDGDTPPDARRAVRDHGRVVLTNPDMLHSGILPHHTRWLKLFENLKYVVIDELHTYRGVFGSHFAHVIQRLRRICRFHGSDPIFICCSATVANPLELTKILTGLDTELIDQSGAPMGEHHLITYNPPVVNRQLSIRSGVVKTSYRIASELITAGVPTIIFAGGRLQVEIILKYLREAMMRDRLSPELVQGYRGGYLPLKRRRIEAGLRAGTVKAVVATNALELGIDIGDLTACVIAGYPGSIASLRQQSGRAGRREGTALTVFVARSSPIDQYLVTHPELLHGAPVEHARANPDNLFVLVDHAKCAAFELPFKPNEPYAHLCLDDTDEMLRYLSSHGVLHESGGEFHWTERTFPAHRVNLRGVHEENFVVIELEQDRVIAEVDFYSAHTTLHEHAIYHVDAVQYQVERLDYDDHKAFVRKVKPDYYTTALTHLRVDVLDENDGLSGLSGELIVADGEVVVSRKVVGFKKVRFVTHENVGYGDVNLPAIEMHTTACWLTIPEAMLSRTPDNGAYALDALNALGHALHVSACVALMCTERDIGVSIGDRSAEQKVAQGRRDTTCLYGPTLYLYDSVPGGTGLASEIRARLVELLESAMSLISSCICEDMGCPACMGTQPRYDGHTRNATLILARSVLNELAP